MRAARLITLILMLALILGWDGALGDRHAPVPKARSDAALAGLSSEASLGDLRIASARQEVRRGPDRGRMRPLLLGLVAAGYVVIGFRFLWAHVVGSPEHPGGMGSSSPSTRSPPALASI